MQYLTNMEGFRGPLVCSTTNSLPSGSLFNLANANDLYTEQWYILSAAAYPMSPESNTSFRGQDRHGHPLDGVTGSGCDATR